MPLGDLVDSGFHDGPPRIVVNVVSERELVTQHAVAVGALGEDPRELDRVERVGLAVEALDKVPPAGPVRCSVNGSP